MGLTGVIYAVVVVAWAAYLLPQALRRHDEAAKKHSIERFSSAMRVLSRRSSASSDRMVLAPARSVDRVLTPSLSPQAANHLRGEVRRPSHAALSAAAARRRRVLLVLVAGVLMTLVLAAFGILPWWSVLVPVALICTFLTTARRQVRQASESYWEEVADLRPRPSNVVRRPPVRVDASHGATKLDAAAANPDDEPTVTLDRETGNVAASDLVEERVEAVAVTTSDGGSLWDPLPVTLPAYVESPMAKRTFRTIELEEPGTWSSGHSERDSQTVAATASEPPAADTAGEESPRAVNG